MRSTHKLGGSFISESRENNKSSQLTSTVYGNGYSSAYVNSVNFSREEMNDAYAKARSQEKLICGSRR